MGILLFPTMNKDDLTKIVERAAEQALDETRLLLTFDEERAIDREVKLFKRKINATRIRACILRKELMAALKD